MYCFQSLQAKNFYLHLLEHILAQSTHNTQKRNKKNRNKIKKTGTFSKKTFIF